MTLGTSFEQKWISLLQGCSLPNINAFHPVVHEKKIFKGFYYININKYVALGRGHLWPQGQTWICLTQGRSMPNNNAFRPVVYEKIIFKDLSKFSLLGPKRGQPLHLNNSASPFPKHVSHQVFLKLTKWFLRRSRLKEKVNRRTNCDGNSSLEPSAQVS